MRITRARIDGIKGVTDDYEFGDVNVITGDNESGKTAILDAIVLGCLGWSPKYGRRPMDIGRAVSGATASVVIDFSDGQQNTFSMQRGRKPVLSTAHEFPVHAFDARAFYDEGPKARQRVVFGASDGIDPLAVTDMARKAVKEADGTHDGREAVLKALLKALKSVEVDGDGIKLVDDILAMIAEERRARRRERDEKQGLVSSLAESVSAVNLAEIDPEIDERLAALNRRIGEVTESARMHAQEAASLEDCEEFQTGYIETDSVPEIVDQSIEALESKLERLKAIEAVDWQRRIDRSRSLLNSWKDKIEEPPPRHPGIECECPKCGHAFQLKSDESPEWVESNASIEARNQVASLETHLADTRAAMEADNQEAFEAAQREIAEIGIQLEELMAERAKFAHNARIKEIAEKVDTHRAEYDKAKDTIAELSARIDGLRKAKSESDEYRTSLKQIEDGRLKVCLCDDVLSILNQTEKSIADWKADKIVAVATRFIAPVNRLAEAVIGGRYTFRDGDFWLASKTGEAHVSSMSGIQLATLYAGLGIALSAGSPSRILIMDEMQAFTRSRRRLLLETVRRMIADGEIDQFFGIDLDPVEADGVSVIHAG